jgi:5-methylcytosine-specific restriction endonuclease McrA
VKKYVNSKIHQDARIDVLKRDNFECQICKGTNRLEMHHISYHIKGIEDKPGSKKWLVMLCSNCHQLVHNTPNHMWNPGNYNKKPVLN